MLVSGMSQREREKKNRVRYTVFDAARRCTITLIRTVDRDSKSLNLKFKILQFIYYENRKREKFGK